MQKYLLAPVTPVGDNGMGVEYVAILPFDDSGYFESDLFSFDLLRN